MNQTFYGVGRTSVADMILQKHRFLSNVPAPKDKPQISPVSPAPNSPVGRITDEIVIEERRRHEEICKQSKANQKYYTRQDCNRPWFSFPRTSSQYSEYVMVTGAMAKTCLENIWSEEEGNRRLDRSTIDKYKRDMLSGSWIPTDEAIGIDYKGKVYNGRHRLTAIKEIWEEGGRS